MTGLIWIFAPEDGSTVVLGEHEQPDGVQGGIAHITRSRELARSWARDLRAGRIPSTAEPEPEPAADESLSD